MYLLAPHKLKEYTLFKELLKTRPPNVHIHDLRHANASLLNI